MRLWNRSTLHYYYYSGLVQVSLAYIELYQILEKYKIFNWVVFTKITPTKITRYTGYGTMNS